MNAPTTELMATETQKIEDALDALLTAAIEADRKPSLTPDRGPVSADVLVREYTESLGWTQARRQADRLLERPVSAALRLSMRTLGRRLHEIGGMALMSEALDRVAARDRANEGRRIGILDHRWDGIGGWTA